MNVRRADDRIHSLEIPLTGFSLLVPSAAVAEVTNPTSFTRVPGAPPWFLGVMGWRSQAVPVVCFEALLGQPIPPAAAGTKIVIFYPMADARDREFYGVVALAEPRPQQVVSNLVEPEDPQRLPDTPYIAAGVKIKGRPSYIPDFDALRRAFYP